MAFHSYTLPSAGTFSAYISYFPVIIGNVFCAIFVFFIDLVGILLGAIRGALIGRETWSGIVMGAATDVIVSVLNGRLVRERFRPEVLSELQDLMGDGETGVEELSRIQVGGGLSEYSIDKIPKFTITNVFDVNYSVCLQDFQIGEIVRSLRECQSMFHLRYIDKWLITHGSCPLCRRDQMHEHTDM